MDLRERWGISWKINGFVLNLAKHNLLDTISSFAGTVERKG